jgi:hypothetical protein
MPAKRAAPPPSWVNTLQNTSIRADMIAADVGAFAVGGMVFSGTVTYSGLEKLIVDLESLLASSSTGLTSSELSDLKTIASNLNNDVRTSPYLTTIFNNLVNGNAANATWTGGNSSSTHLGNLAVGSSNTLLALLNDKWFLGTDLPSSRVALNTSSGADNFSVYYQPSSQPLFGSTGPSMNDINQGHLSDCYLMASLAEVANNNPNIISSMFTSNGNNTYGVRFYVNGVANYVTVNNELADGGSKFNNGADIWASLAEKAYAQLQDGGAGAGGDLTGKSAGTNVSLINYGPDWSSIGNNGYARFALEEITGATQITEFQATGNFWGTGYNYWSTAVYNQSLTETGYSPVSTTAAVQNTLIGDLEVGDDLVLSSNTNAYDRNGKQTLVADHVLSIYGFDNATGMFEVRNPWGTSTSGQYWDTTFEVDLATLLKDGDLITADNVGGGAFGSYTNPQPPLPPWGGVGATRTATTNIVDPNPGGTHIIPAGGATVGFASANAAPTASASVDLLRNYMASSLIGPSDAHATTTVDVTQQHSTPMLAIAHG